MSKNAECDEREKGYKKALEKFRGLAQENPEVYTPHVAMILSSLGTFYWKTQNYNQAEEMYTEALEIRRILAQQNPVYNPDVATTLNNIGNLYGDTQRFSEAEKAYTEALKIRRDLAGENPVYKSQVVTTLNNLGILYNGTKRFSEAEKAFNEALHILKRFTEQDGENHAPDMAMILLNVGALYYDMQKFSRAEKAYKEALKIYRKRAEENADIYADVALTLNNLGALYLQTQKYSEAEDVYAEALEMRRELAMKNFDMHIPYVAMILKNLGVLYTYIQKYREAEKVYTEALKIRKILEVQNPDVFAPHVAAILNNLGNFYKDTQRFAEAEKAFTEALEKYNALAKKNPAVYTPAAAATLDSLGSLYTVTHKFSEAEKVYIKSLEMRRELAEQNPEVFTPDMALTLNNLGNLYTYTQKYSEAEKAYTQALKMGRELAVKNPDVHLPLVAMILGNLGNVYSDTQKYSEAEGVYTEALDMRRELAVKNYDVHIGDIAAVLTNLGNLYKDTQRYPQAERAFHEALKIRRILEEKNPDVFAPEVASTLNNLGNLYKDMQRYDEAEKVYTESAQKFRGIHSWFDTARSLYNRFTISFDEKTLDDSRKLLEMAVLFSREERYTYIQKGRYENIYLTLLARDVTTFGVLEALRDPQRLSLPWGRILYQKELERAQYDLNFQKSLVEKTLEEKSDFEFDSDEIPENTLFIYVQVMRDYLLFYVVSNNCVKEYTCGKEFVTIGGKLLFNLMIQKGAAPKTKDLTFVTEKFDSWAAKWSKTIPEEIRTLIKEKECIVFSPDLRCSHFPLEALPINGEPLCMGKTVLRATSLHQFLNLSKISSFDSSLVVGNPWPHCDEKKLLYSLPSKPEYFKIPFLQNALEEAEFLTKKLPSGTVLLGQNATGERFLSEISKHSLIHFSGHGDQGRILFLSGPLKGFPPPFEPEEFSDLRKAERIEGTKRINMMEEWHPVTDMDLYDIPVTEGAVIFLNACETGQHKYAGGGYFQGLPAVFLKNGAHSVVSSLVPLFDKHSKEFSLHFYENLLRTCSVAKSLKKARTWAKDKYKAQIYWLPYIHFGPPQ